MSCSGGPPPLWKGISKLQLRRFEWGKRTSILGGPAGYWRRRLRIDRLPARAGSRRVEVDRRSSSVAEGRSLRAHRCIDPLVADSLAGRSLGRAVGILAVVVDSRMEHRLELGCSCVGEGSVGRRERGRSRLVGIDCMGPTFCLCERGIIARS